MASSRNCSCWSPAERRVLDDRQVDVVVLVGPDRVEPQRERAHVRRELLSGHPVESGIHVEPLLQDLLAAREGDVVEIAGEEDVPEADREPALERVDALELPAADDRRRPLSAGSRRSDVRGPTGTSQMPLIVSRCGTSWLEMPSQGFGSAGFRNSDRFGETRERVVAAERVPAREPPLQADLQRVVPRLSPRSWWCSRRRNAGTGAAGARARWSGPGSRRPPSPASIRRTGSAPRRSGSRSLAWSRTRARAQVLQRCGVDVPRGLDVGAMVADIRRFEHPPPRQLALHANLPALHPRRHRARVEERDALPQERLDAQRRSDRLLDASLERVRQRVDEASGRCRARASGWWSN